MLVYGENEHFISNGRVGNVLIGLLEDDLAIQEMLRLLLQSEGHEVAIYASADECLADLRVDESQASCAAPDLVIIDLHLAKSISGMEVIERIRANPRLSGLPLAGLLLRMGCGRLPSRSRRRRRAGPQPRAPSPHPQRTGGGRDRR